MAIDFQEKRELSLLTARATFYSFISSLYSDPTSTKFSLLYDRTHWEVLKSACEEIDAYGSKDRDGLKPSVDHLFSLLSSEKDDTEENFVRIFGHTLSKVTAPYELEHLKNDDVFYRTQSLADLTGFYRAFGLEIGANERADHVSVEAEFLSFLLTKELIAREANLGQESVTVCQKAQMDFWNDHFSGWVRILVRTLSTQEPGQFYPAASEFVSSFLELESLRYSDAPQGKEK
ncbi:MAG: molecular chaperone [Fidelibacterota bacterium]